MGKRPPPPPRTNVSGGFSRAPGLTPRIPVHHTRVQQSPIILRHQPPPRTHRAPIVPAAPPSVTRLIDARQPAERAKILVRMPTRARPAQALDVLTKYRDMAGTDILLEAVIDDDDASMQTKDVWWKLGQLGCTITSGPHKSKVEAANGGCVTGWDILVLASDDMVPVVNDWALRVERDMLTHFPQLDGALHYNDGHTADKLCTLPIQGRRLYAQFGYVYSPQYRSLWCDNEQTDVLRSMGRLVYLPNVVIKHKHPITDKAIVRDALYVRNDASNDADRAVYQGRKARNFNAPVLRQSILIATIPERSAKLRQLLDHVWAQALKHPREVEVIVDAGGGSIGAKRQRLLTKARGEFVAFIDDDDKVSNDYVDRILAAIAKNPTADCVEFHVAMHSGGLTYVGHCSIRHAEWATVNGVFVRSPNHLNPVRRTHALKAGFPDKTFGEDYDYSTKLKPFLRAEAPLSAEPLYFYYPSSDGAE